MDQFVTKNEGYGDFSEGWVPFLLEIQAKKLDVGRYGFTALIMLMALRDY